MRLLLILLLVVIHSATYAMENVLYVLHADRANAMDAINKNKPLNPIIIAQSYQINKEGTVSGAIDADLLQFSQQNTIKLLAMITNSGFKAADVHLFLNNLAAQKKVLDFLLEECKKNQLAGVQFDFEMVPLKDKNALTAFYETAANLFHQHGFMVSFAIAPTLMDSNFPTHYQRKLYEVWQGAYDFKKLGEISDFVTIMSYDQHASGTTPGPIASYPWDEQVIKHALQFIPANKISLGIPTYSGLWYLSMSARSGRITIHYDSLSYQQVQYILHKFKPHVHWDPVNKVNYTFYESSGINKYLFIEDNKSFMAKSALAKKYHLRGISLFRLGIEDLAIWNQLKDRPWWKFWS